MNQELSRGPLERIVGRLSENATALYDERPKISDDLRDAAQVVGSVIQAIDWIVRGADNMAQMRLELCKESIKVLDRGLMDNRNKISASQSLEEKLALMKDRREMEHIRAERRKRLFDLMDDGAIYAHDPLPRDELVALVARLREFLQPPNAN